MPEILSGPVFLRQITSAVPGLPTVKDSGDFNLPSEWSSVTLTFDIEMFRSLLLETTEFSYAESRLNVAGTTFKGHSRSSEVTRRYW